MGRRNGSEELKIVAEWIKKKYREFNLKPFIGESYFQEYSYQRRDTINERNIIGILKGAETKNRKYIVVSAHFDHIGIRSGQADSICNGADDNATGISTLLSVAQYFSVNKIKPRHSIIFASFSGEENGLQGSRYFCKNLNINTEDIILNINFEMLGRPEAIGKQNYYITGIEFTNLYDILIGYNLDKEWRVENIGEFNKMLFRMSDNFPFASINSAEGKPGIPAHTFAIGLPGNDYLHRPNDEARFIDFENMVDFSKYISGFVYYLSVNDIEIKWIKDFN
jgi:Zn-dependent M28 family amino/carboxypeptidase